MTIQYKAPIEAYTGAVREITIGTGSKTLKMGGENALPFHFFDQGAIPNPPHLALEVWDMPPGDWAQWVLEPYQDVIADPVAWAKKAVEYGADALSLHLASADPGAADTPPEASAEMVKSVAEAIPVPLIVYGPDDEKKNAAVLVKVAEVCQGQNLLLGPAVKENYEVIAKAVLEHGHCLIAQTSLDINLMKELNIKICKSFPPERVVIDPESPTLGYGLEYGFSIMERTKQTGVIFKDNMTQMPIIANLGSTCWKTKEAKENRKQGMLWEGITAVSLLLAGANIAVLRHPETLRHVKTLFGLK
ncbi:MAG: acetyl-CoA decarbonylase/synthase complex subunit delta [Dehalococcoidia bacterium]|nr:acetyl-CoA decarbonylase/synthase complex subunit delta [Dehalococcoidia bacterium]